MEVSVSIVLVLIASSIKCVHMDSSKSTTEVSQGKESPSTEKYLGLSTTELSQMIDQENDVAAMLLESISQHGKLGLSCKTIQSGSFKLLHNQYWLNF